jgi:preprotein translocase subunit SecE
VQQEEEEMFNTIGDFCKRVGNYCMACYDELRYKTTWPTRSELSHSAVVVLTASLVIALVVWCMDVVFKAVMTAIYPA